MPSGFKPSEFLFCAGAGIVHDLSKMWFGIAILFAVEHQKGLVHFVNDIDWTFVHFVAGVALCPKIDALQEGEHHPFTLNQVIAHRFPEAGEHTLCYQSCYIIGTIV